ncbi:MAG: hypothetical protein AAFY63_20525 [Cyanobacteria bacterium J06643_13]
MKTVNGKLLEQLSEESEVVKQQIDLRYGQIESLLSKQREYQLITYQTEVEKFQTLCQEVGERIENLESSKLERHETSLYRTKQQAPLKLLWLTFSSSIAIGLISICTWLDLSAAISPQIDSSKIKTENIR